jgi:hypothetical protein
VTRSRREFLTLLGGAVVGSSTIWPARAVEAQAWRLEDFAQNIQSGGPPKDGIPSIDRLKFVSAADSEKFLKSDDIVFGLAYRGLRQFSCLLPAAQDQNRTHALGHKRNTNLN